MTDKQYYSEKRVSSSSLKWFEHSPWYFKNMLDKEIIQAQLSWLELGRQIHMSILEPHLFEKNYINLDYTVPKSANQQKFCEEFTMLSKHGFKEPADEALAKIQAYDKAYNTKGKSENKIEEEADKLYTLLQPYIEYLEKSKTYKDILSDSKWNLIQTLKLETSNHKLASKLLQTPEPFSNVETYNEYVIFWEYVTEDGKMVPCKSMIDRLVIDNDKKVVKLVDLKTTSHIGNFKQSIETFKYYRQFAFYKQAILSEFKHIKKYKFEVYVIALQTKELPECKVFKIPDNDIEVGTFEIEQAMDQIAWHFENDQWKYSKNYYENDGLDDTIYIN